LLGVGGYFYTRKDRGVVDVFSILTRLWVYVGVCVCIFTHTHTAQMGYSVVTLNGPQNSRWTKSRHTHIRISVQITHVHVYAKRRDEILD